MRLKFKEVTPENWRKINAPKVNENQEEYVANNTAILARTFAYRMHNSKVYALHIKDNPIGMIDMLKIGDFSGLSNTSFRMLRHYDEINLFKPIMIDSNTGYRYCNANQLDVINQISMYKELGISLTGIKKYLKIKMT